LGKDKEEPINGKDNQLVIPSVMNLDAGGKQVLQDLRQDLKASQNQTVDLSKYYVMEGMQNKDKLDFFTELINDDDTLRMNTIEAFNNVSILCIRKTSPHNMQKIIDLNKAVYQEHVRTHKTNMVSKGRARENAYVKILSSDSSDSGVVPTGIKKFFGIGGKKQ